MNTLDQFLKDNASVRLFKGGFGFEKENLRVNRDGSLSETPHPTALGDKLTHPYITTDFSESQIEMVTPVRSSVEEALGFLETIHDLVSMNIGTELLWPQSSPPSLPVSDDQIPIANFGAEGRDREEYREHLSSIYGRKKQLVCGVHFNISLEEEELKRLYKKFPEEMTYSDFKAAIYMKAVRNFKRNKWFLISLLGASPVVHESYVLDCVSCLPKLNDSAHHFEYATSMRNSVCGYRNNEILNLDYNSLDQFETSMLAAIEKGQIESEKENYSTVRIKKNSDDQISHLEIRLMDLNPFVKTGIDLNEAKLVHAFLVHCLLAAETTEFTKHTLEIAAENHDIAASDGLNPKAKIIMQDGSKENIQYALQYLLSAVNESLNGIWPEEYQEAKTHLELLVAEPIKRPAARLTEILKDEDYLAWHLQKAEEYLEQSIATSYAFHGLADMELSTQLLMREAVLRGVKVAILDRPENFICLSEGEKVEYVKQATKTSLDNYASILMMENKVVTKVLLRQAGINCPDGGEYNDAAEMKADFDLYKNQAIVVKPKSTNFGLGITILKENNSVELFHQAVDLAFSQDNSVLIEEFVSGKEYRIFVIGDEVVGILHRVPANVSGNGVDTIRELILEKNKSPLRGKGYKTPLEKINIGVEEEMFLKTQGMSFDTVPVDGQVVYLRENSNISTGGDSIDCTDDVPDSYKKIAVAAAKAMNVEITGLDMMIDSLEEEATAHNHSIIELNFNPAIHIHCHPFVGKNRKLNAKLLDALGF